MKENICSVHKWVRDSMRYIYLVLVPLLLFCAAVWWNALLDGPSEFTVRYGAWGFIVLFLCIIRLDSKIKLAPRLANGMLKTDHGETIEKVIEQIRDEPVRYVAVFGENNQKIIEYTMLSPYSCGMDSFIRQLIATLDNAAIIFNHPIINNDGYSRAFDEEELKTIVRGKIATAIIVAPDMTYTLEIPTGKDPKLCWKRARKKYKIAKDKTKWFFALGRTRKRLRSIKTIEYVAERMNWDFRYEEYQ